MIHRPSRAGYLLLPLLWICLVSGPLLAEEEEYEFLGDESRGVLELQGEKILRLDAVRGHISLRRGNGSELQFAATREDKRKEELPIQLWVRGRELLLAPSEQTVNERYYLEIIVPSELFTIVNTTDSTLSSAGLHGDLELAGTQSRIHIRGQAGALTVRQEGGTIDVDGVALDAQINLVDVKGRVRRLQGPAELDARDSTLELIDVSNTLSIELENTTLIASKLQARGQLTASGGSVDLRDCQRGLTMELDETPLTLTDVAGLADVDTNSTVRFENVGARLRVRGYGARVQGRGARFGVDIETTDADVILEDIAGNSFIRGDSLRVTLNRVTAQSVTVETHYSVINVTDIDAELTLSNDFGDVSIKGAKKALTIVSQGGSVRAQKLSATLNLTGEGETFEASWATAPTDGESIVTNNSGDVRLALAGNGGIKVSAEAEYGEIVSSLAELEISGDHKSGSGVIGSGRTNSTLVAKAAGSVYLDSVQVVGGSQ